ncbi:hypothetical protein NEF87_000409 [Candidatus Lokiarchaeum ossiferum]|uniref:Zinc-ribbon domain-containing protein n=1 Tax=Candidatus Lokiarchaeum ossiferum TaxID=2951803 RepID=A0ABY6HKT1_9ARCH|nr:hypothetical protein NEF87_000409 [Candidatus Lokiarchaeum sp. B-35]
MIYCPNCGEELVDEAVFCAECGTKIDLRHPSDIKPKTQKRTQKTPPHRKPTPAYSSVQMNKKARSPNQTKTAGKIGIAIIVGIMVISGLSYGFSFIGPKTTLQDTVTYQDQDPILSAQTMIPVRMDITSADVKFQYNSTIMNNSIKIQANYDLLGRFKEVEDVNQILDINFSTLNEEINFEVKFKDDNNDFSDRTSINITLRTDLEYYLDIELYSGDLIIETGEDCVINRMEVQLTSGDAQVIITPNSYVRSAININSLYGNIDFTAEKTIFNSSLSLTVTSGTISSDISQSHFRGIIDFQMTTGQMNLIQSEITCEKSLIWNMQGTSGDIYLDLEQHISPLANMSIQVELISGDIDVNYLGNASVVRAIVNSSTSTGEINYQAATGFNESDGQLYSTNVDILVGFNLDLSTISGKIDFIGSSLK